MQLLDRFEVEELVVRQRERRFDQALDVESPLVDEHAWLHERRVDDVVVLVRGDARRDAGKRVHRGIGRRDIGARSQTPSRRCGVAEAARADRGDPGERQRNDRDDRGDRGGAEQRAPSTGRRGCRVRGPVERARQDERERNQEHRGADGGVDEARDRFDPLW